jgi:hypothetical protein
MAHPQAVRGAAIFPRATANRPRAERAARQAL